MKKSVKAIKTIPVAIFASVCLATTASAYLDMGDSISYSVKSNAKTWDNKNNTWAWYLHSPTDCYFSGTGLSGCVANYTLYEWTFGQDEYYITGASGSSNGFLKFIPSSVLVDDDYFARVEYVSGGINNGTVTFGKYKY